MSEPQAQSRVHRSESRPDGLAFQLASFSRGVLEIPELNNVIVSIQSGSGARMSCRRDGRNFTGTAVHGDIDIIPPQTPARWEMHDDNDTGLILSIPQAMLNMVARELGLPSERVEIRNRFQVRDLELENLAWSIQREMELGGPSGRIYLDALALAAASRLVACHSSMDRALPDTKDRLSGHRLKQVLAFIDDQLGEDLSLERIAGAAGISPSHLKTVFRKATGLPVHQYVIRRRVERASSLLSGQNLTTAEVAFACGFAHQSHMARHMKRVLGRTPRAMREG